MVSLPGPKTVIAGNLSKEKRSYMCRSVAEVHSTLLDLRIFMLRKKSDLKKRGKIRKEVKLYALTRERQVKFFVSKA
jgi:hypothetical protein